MLGILRKSEYISEEWSASNNFKKVKNEKLPVDIYMVTITLLARTGSIMKSNEIT
jgi:hypothetical protein